MKSAFKLVAVLLFALASHAFAGEIKPYSKTEFDALAAQGKPVIVAVHANWCPTCKAQAPIQRDLMSRPDFKDYTLFMVDFDSQKPLVRELKVTMQSTLIVFKGRAEVARSTGETSPAGIETLFRKAKA